MAVLRHDGSADAKAYRVLWTIQESPTQQRFLTALYIRKHCRRDAPFSTLSLDRNGWSRCSLTIRPPITPFGPSMRAYAFRLASHLWTAT